MGNSESQPVRNVDKRSARRDHAHLFKEAIYRYRQEHMAAVPTYPANSSLIHDPSDALRVGASCDQTAKPTSAQLPVAKSKRISTALTLAVRRRPLFPRESEQNEFDVRRQADKLASSMSACE